ncbi:MAG: hypothetical protein P4L41_13960 [Flavipsychrobacter sp.]|nr:hypothetical protein [Flavipsychrobacter sp.]
MKKITLVIFTLLICGGCFAADSLNISINKTSFLQGDLVQWQCDLKHYTRAENAITVQLWIENMQTGQTWQYRYPLINGYAEGTLTIGNDIPDGKYAFNFLLQKDFFNIKGVVRDYARKDSFLNYMVLYKGKKNIIDKAPLTKRKSFAIRNLLFQDTALFMFSPSLRKNNGELWIDAVTSLDSSFVPAAKITKFIYIGPQDTFAKSKFTAIKEQDYQFDEKAKMSKYLLPEVVVTAKRKVIEDFAREHVSPLFTGIDDITFDGLTNDDISRSIDINTFLMEHVPGIQSQMNPTTGVQELMWRNNDVAVYINEFLVDTDIPLSVNPSDVAMIKVFRPGFAPGNLPSSGGVVAIYTKIGSYDNNSGKHKNTFSVRGYDPLKSTWQ